MEIVEAARIDGLSEIGIFFRMFFPMMKSTYAAAATMIFMNAWNNYLWPKVIMTKGEAQTMPTVIVFFVLQKNFAEGLTGSIK